MESVHVHKSMSERAAAADAYAKRKHTGYVECITEAGKEDELEYNAAATFAMALQWRRLRSR